MYDRSAASASSNSDPANADPGSMSAKKVRAVRSSRFSVRFMKWMISRTSQCDWCATSVRSTASTASRSPSVRMTTRADFRLVDPQPQQRIVELAEGAQRPELIAGLRGSPPASTAAGRSGAWTVSSAVRLSRLNVSDTAE